MSQKNETSILVLALLITLGILGGGFWWFTRRASVDLRGIVNNQSQPAGQSNVESFAKVQNVPSGLFSYGVREQVEAAWTQLSDASDIAGLPLRARAQSLLDKTVNAKSELATDTESVSQVVVQLKDRVAALEDELTQQLEDTKAAIAGLNDGIEAQAPELEVSLKEAADALAALQDKDIGSETEQTSFSNVGLFTRSR